MRSLINLRPKESDEIGQAYVGPSMVHGGESIEKSILSPAPWSILLFHEETQNAT